MGEEEREESKVIRPLNGSPEVVLSEANHKVLVFFSIMVLP